MERQEVDGCMNWSQADHQACSWIGWWPVGSEGTRLVWLVQLDEWGLLLRQGSLRKEQALVSVAQVFGHRNRGHG